MSTIIDQLLEKIEIFNLKHNHPISIDIEYRNQERYDVKVYDTRDGLKTLSIKENGKELLLYSKYNVQEEIERFLDELKEINTKSVIIVFGLGFGYHITELLKKISNDNKVIILEPSIKVFLEALKSIELEDILKDGVNIIVGQDVHGAHNHFCKNIHGNNLNNIHFVIFGQYGRAFNSFVKEIFEDLKNTIINEEVNLATEYQYQFVFSGNMIKNIPYLLESESISVLENRFKSYPAIVVSAGPSLDKNIQELKKAQGKAVIISGGRTLKPLLKNGIIPTFVVSIDPSYYAYELVEDYLEYDFPLITMPMSSNDIIKKYSGKHFIINNYSYTELVNKIMNKRVPTLFSGGSVAHSSTALAHYMGCNPIILVGQDLAFTNQKVHAEQAIIEGRINTQEGKTILVKDVNGNEINTSKSLYSFKQWFEKYFALNNHITYIDATEGGAKIKGTEICKLKDAISRYCKIKIPEIQDLMETQTTSNESYQKAVKIMNDINKELELMKQLVEKGIKLNKKAYQYYQNEKKINITGVLKELDDIDAQIIQMSDSSILLTSAVIPAIRRINLDNELLERVDDSEYSRTLKVVRKSQTLYKGILVSIDAMKPLVDETIDILIKNAER